MKDKEKRLDRISRRGFFSLLGRNLSLLGLGVGTGVLTGQRRNQPLVWQIDPAKCRWCDRCATECILTPSAVKCVHAFSICGYCELCFGFFQPGNTELTTAAENQLCPTGAIKRKFIEYPYFEYSIDEKLCIGCAKCVNGCTTFGNGSLHLQIRHDRCENCSECYIARVCPVDAFVRVPADHPYLIKQPL